MLKENINLMAFTVNGFVGMGSNKQDQTLLEKLCCSGREEENG